MHHQPVITKTTQTSNQACLFEEVYSKEVDNYLAGAGFTHICLSGLDPCFVHQARSAPVTLMAAMNADTGSPEAL